MRIAQVCPLHESCPPKLYGGTERIVSYLTEELVELGHEVTLFASGDSITSACLEAAWPRALRLTGCSDPIVPHLMMLKRVVQLADGFDLIHFHTDCLHFPSFADRGVPCLTTLHGRLDIPELQPFYATFPELPLVSISQAQRAPVPDASWLATVHHGLPLDLLRFNPAPQGEYLAFLGRIAPEKRPDRAIEIARRANMKLRIAAKVDHADRDYFERHIRPLLDDPLIEFMGEIDEQQKNDFLGNASAMLFPVDWPEPFGLVMIEAMACGTPVIAYPHGAVPEVIDQGITGFMVQNIDEAVAALDQARRLDRAAIRRRFEQRFSASRMARDYVALYRRLAADPRTPALLPGIHPREIAAAGGVG